MLIRHSVSVLSLGALSLGVILASAGSPSLADDLKPAVSLFLSKVSVERGASTRFGCEVVLDNATGKALVVRSCCGSAFDGLQLVVTTKEGKALVQQTYSFSKSPFASERECPLKQGRTTATLWFPVRRDLLEDAEVVRVRLVGMLVGREYQHILSTETIEVEVKEQVDKRISKEVESATPDAPKANDLEDGLFPLPPREVAAGKFEQWQREAAKKPSSVTYTRVEYDRKAYWVVEASFGYGDPSEKIAVYAPMKDGSFRRCLLAGPLKAATLTVAVDAKTGMLNLREEANNRTKGEVVLSCNLKAIGVFP